MGFKLNYQKGWKERIVSGAFVCEQPFNQFVDKS